MFVISADQKSSRSTGDIVGDWKEIVNRDYAGTLTLPADRNAGDEIQVLTADAETVLDIALRLVRSERWSVGIGIGAVRRPLPLETREASGPAFNAARDAVTAAKKRPTRIAVSADLADSNVWPAAEDAQNLLDLLLEIRRKRTTHGWELYDTLNQVATQAQAAQKLGVTQAAVSERFVAAGIRIERAARPSLVRLFTGVDNNSNTQTDGNEK